MFIPIPDFQDQCVILKGPSRSFWICHHNLFEEVAAESGKEMGRFTKNAFKHDAIGINQSEERKWVYHLFIWPLGTCLDNNIFSGYSETCKADFFAHKLKGDHAMNPFRKDMNAITISWTVGISGGHHFEDDDEVSNTDMTSLF
eukprot:756548-Ditylum_brightwellii.AAC.1